MRRRRLQDSIRRERTDLRRRNRTCQGRRGRGPVILVAGVTLLLLTALAPSLRAGLPPDSQPGGRVFDLDTHCDTNDLDMIVTNLGSFAWDMMTGNPALIYPRGTTRTAMFAGGIWMGARAGGELRVTVAEYSAMWSPGPILSPTSWGDEQSPWYRVYKINLGDTPESNPDYGLWLNWPPGVPGGPPLVNGGPRLLADQTLWSVYNDLNPNSLENPAGTPEPLGVELRQSAFAFSGAPNQRIILMEYVIQNRGLLQLEDAYVSLWSDPDLGGPADDLVGCDVSRQVGFCYNATNDDRIYGSEPPAVGIVLLQGPIVPDPGNIAWVNGVPVPDHRNLTMTSFQKYINGTDPDSPVVSYNYMQGLNADGSPMVNPVTGEVTTFSVSGDPVDGSGWVDEYPSDRRMMVTCGPFDMAPGDVQIVTWAVVIGQGSDRLASVTDLRTVADRAREAFGLVFPPEPTPVLLASFDATSRDDGILLTWRMAEETLVPGFWLERDCGEGWRDAVDEPLAGSASGEFLDREAVDGAVCRYRLAVIGPQGERVLLGETSVEVHAAALELGVGRNPALGEVRLFWRAPDSERVALEVISPSGRLLTVLYRGPGGPQRRSLQWDGRDASGRFLSGIVWLRLHGDRGTRTAPLVLLR